MAAGRVKIGPNFFKKAFQDYSNWKFAIVREACQNCIDAPRSTKCDLTIVRDGADTLFQFSNNGQPMSEDELLNKLLALGESGKDGLDTVGGMGKAKELLYLCHRRYEITTGNLRVVGSGGDYELEYLDEPFNGTMSKVWVDGYEVDELLEKANMFVYTTQWGGVFSVNGKTYKGQFRKGHPRREFSWGTVYTNRGLVDRLVVRIKGVPMFTRYLGCNGRCVLVELKGRSTEILQSNRDNLRWEYRDQLDALVDSITVDKSSALFREEAPVYFRYSGDKLRYEKVRQLLQDAAAKAVPLPSVAASDPYQAAYATVPTSSRDVEEEAAVAVGERPDGVSLYNQPVLEQEDRDEVIRVEQQRSQLQCEFVVKNETGMRVPEYYLPTDLSAYSKKIVSVWVQSLMMLHRVFDCESTFSVGFIFHSKNEAEFERSSEYGSVYYLNPAVVVKQDYSNSRSFKKRWNLTPAGKWAILACAAHEFVHGAFNLSSHDEGYANKLTEVFAVILAKREFVKCLK